MGGIAWPTVPLPCLGSSSLLVRLVVSLPKPFGEEASWCQHADLMPSHTMQPQGMWFESSRAFQLPVHRQTECLSLKRQRVPILPEACMCHASTAACPGRTHPTPPPPPFASVCLQESKK